MEIERKRLDVMTDRNSASSVNWKIEPSSSGKSVDVLVAGLPEDGSLPPSLADLDAADGGWLQRLIQSGQLRGKRGELTLLGTPSASGPLMVLVVGLGNAPASRSVAMESAASAVRLLSDRSRGEVAVMLAESIERRSRRSYQAKRQINIAQSLEQIPWNTR